MSYVPAKVQCDVCGIVRAESNHWWQVTAILIGLRKRIMVEPFDGQSAQSDYHEHMTQPQHACGPAHALALVSNTMEGK